MICALACASTLATDWRLLPEVGTPTADSAYICHLWGADIYAPGEPVSCYVGTILVVDLHSGVIRYHHRGAQGLADSQDERDLESKTLAAALRDGGFRKLDQLSFELLEQKVAAMSKVVAEQFRSSYLADFDNANTLASITAFEQRYRDDDPDNLIPKLGPLKARLELQAYRSAYENATTSVLLGQFIRDYQENDLEGLIPAAKKRYKLLVVQEAEALQLAERRSAEQKAALERDALQQAAKERAARLRYIDSLRMKYAKSVKSETAEGYQLVAQFKILCPNPQRRVIPLLTVLYRAAQDASYMGGELKFYIRNQGKSVRIYSQAIANGKVLGPALLSYELNEWGDLHAVGGQKLAIMNGCFDSGAAIWLTPGDPGF